MVRRKSKWPTVDELVICTVTKIFAQGTFVSLDEYENKEGMVHISEVASGWIKNIRDHIREGQKTVCKVLAVDENRGHVDLSLRRVKDSQRRWKTEEWKREQRAEKLLELAADRLGKSLDVAYEEVGFLLQEKFGNLYSAFESIASGVEVLNELGVDENWANVLYQVSASIVETPSFKVVGYLDLSCPTYNGVETLRSAMTNARDSIKSEDIDAEFYYVGAPRYRIEVVAPSYKLAESAMQRAVELSIDAVKKVGGTGEFHLVQKG